LAVTPPATSVTMPIWVHDGVVNVIWIGALPCHIFNRDGTGRTACRDRDRLREIAVRVRLRCSDHSESGAILASKPCPVTVTEVPSGLTSLNHPEEALETPLHMHLLMAMK
jgi:hypothetical protein